jgi:spore coat protein CotH
VRRLLVSIAVVYSAIGCGPPPGDPFPPGEPGEHVFANDILHVVSIEVDDRYLHRLETDRDNRVPCTITFDGLEIAQVGIRQKGGASSSSNLDGKPAFSIKANEFVGGLRIDGLKRLWLNNALEDVTLLSEPLGYGTYHRMAIPASRTSHAIVSLNGRGYGVYVVVETVADDLFDRAFGPDNDDGNLYEGSRPPESGDLGDFVTHPEAIELKDEVAEGRSREDIIALAAAVRESSDDDFEAEVSARLDLDGYITALAIDTFVGYWDSYSYFVNNYYLYHHPGTDRFVYLPHGMDQLVYADPGDPLGILAQRVSTIPSLAARLDAELVRVHAAWDVAAIHAEIDHLAALLADAPPDDATDRDRTAFEASVGDVRAAVDRLGATE